MSEKERVAVADAAVANRGRLNDREVSGIREFIKDNYREMYLRWPEISDEGFFGSK